MLRTPSRPRRARAGFTLIELLIVIAIIGILAGLMAGGINYVQNSAKRNTCLNNLRQWGGALTQYLAEHKDKFPTYDGSDLKSETAWFNALPPYLEKSLNTSTYRDLAANGRSIPHPGDGSQSLFLCPVDGGESGKWESDATEHAANLGYYSSYTMNTWVKNAANKPPLTERLRRSQLQSASAFVVMTETCHGSVGGANPASNLYDPETGATAFRHNQAINLLFADGHSASFPKGTVWDAGMTSEDNRGGLQWNPNRGVDNQPL